MSYAMSGLRRALYGGEPPAGVEPGWTGPVTDLTVLGTTCLVLLALACWVASRRTKA